jgi:hypothetical protein
LIWRRRSDEPPPITLFGWDMSLVLFVTIITTVIAFGMYYLLFTRLPIPRYCIAKEPAPCGYFSREHWRAPRITWP